MKPVFTSADLHGIAPGGEVVIAPGSLVTPLAREEAERRGITLRVIDPTVRIGPPGGAETAPAAPLAAVQAAGPVGGEVNIDAIVQTVIEEVLSYLGMAPGSLVGKLPNGSNPDGRCIERGAHETPQVMEAGASRVSASPSLSGVDSAIAKLIDHTLLKPDASPTDIAQLCREAVHFGFASVCVNPWNVPLAAQWTRGSGVKVCAVVGFPLGATLPQVKVREAEEAIKLGAQEIDVVQNVGALKAGHDEQVEADIRGVAEVSHRAGAICKVILETALLTKEEKVRAALLAKRAGADFVKTSTGFASAGATVEDVALLRAAVGGEIGVKASGGIRCLADLQAMVSAGATRIGTSAGVKIIEETRGITRASPVSPLPMAAAPAED